jgi:hypothetical protein
VALSAQPSHFLLGERQAGTYLVLVLAQPLDLSLSDGRSVLFVGQPPVERSDSKVHIV